RRHLGADAENAIDALVRRRAVDPRAHGHAGDELHREVGPRSVTTGRVHAHHVLVADAPQRVELDVDAPEERCPRLVHELERYVGPRLRMERPKHCPRRPRTNRCDELEETDSVSRAGCLHPCPDSTATQRAWAPRASWSEAPHHSSSSPEG